MPATILSGDIDLNVYGDVACSLETSAEFTLREGGFLCMEQANPGSPFWLLLRSSVYVSNTM